MTDTLRETVGRRLRDVVAAFEDNHGDVDDDVAASEIVADAMIVAVLEGFPVPDNRPDFIQKRDALIAQHRGRG